MCRMSLSCLHQAVCSGRVHQTRLFLDIGVKPSLKDNQGRTPLMLAVCIINETVALRIARLLLSRGARVDCADFLGRTALSYACEKGRCRLVSLLLDDDSTDVNMADKDGNTPLMYAAMSGDVATLREILHVVVKYRLSVDLRNKKGFSAYLLAARMANTECARVLKTEAKASVNVRDTEFFLSGKEWARKVRKKLEEGVETTARKARPKTSMELGCTSTINPRGSSRLTTRSDLNMTSRNTVTANTANHYIEEEANTEHTAKNLRVLSRLTTLSDLNVSSRNSARGNPSYPYVEEEINSEHDSMAGSDSSSSYSSENQEISVPSNVRTHSHVLHAIFSQYAKIDTRPPVTIADRRFLGPISTVDLSTPLKPTTRNSSLKKTRKKIVLPI